MEIQLDFNILNKTPEEVQAYIMQKQIDELCKSMDKVRRKLFSELTEMKKTFSGLQKENQELKTMLKDLKNGPEHQAHGQEGYLFDVQKYRESVG